MQDVMSREEEQEVLQLDVNMDEKSGQTKTEVTRMKDFLENVYKSYRGLAKLRSIREAKLMIEQSSFEYSWLEDYVKRGKRITAPYTERQAKKLHTQFGKHLKLPLIGFLLEEFQKWGDSRFKCVKKELQPLNIFEQTNMQTNDPLPMKVEPSEARNIAKSSSSTNMETDTVPLREAGTRVSPLVSPDTLTKEQIRETVEGVDKRTAERERKNREKREELRLRIEVKKARLRNLKKKQKEN